MRSNYWFIGLVIGLLVISTSKVFGQLEIRPIGFNQSAEKGARRMAIRDTIDLPFWDDFSFSQITPDSILWEINKGVLINATLGKVSPTVNVASFDGNQITGQPHDQSSVVGIETDQLTSQPIDLAKVSETKRASVVLSFYWQMEGFGEVPESKDSLKLEFKNVNGDWIRVFSIIGIEDNLHADFTRSAVAIDDENYFHSGFQFRFTSVGNGGGPYDAWHLDYVYLNQDRIDGHEDFLDRSIASLPSSIFKQYTMIPRDILFNYPDTIYQDISVELSQFDPGNRTVTLEYTLTNYRYLGTDSVHYDTLVHIIDEEGNVLVPGDLPRRVTNDVPAIQSSNLLGYDSLFLQSEMIFASANDGYFISSIDGGDTTYLINDQYNYKLNDTVRRYHEVHHTLAYDDGSAEYAAGLNKNEAQLAIYFDIAGQDTLTHIDIYFPQMNPSSTGQRILLSVMSVSENGPDQVRRAQEYAIPGDAALNEFSRFTFDIPIVVENEFYIALQQFENDYIGIGLDNNNKLGTQKIWVKTEDEWFPNIKVEGMLMMRPIFKKANLLTTAVELPVIDLPRAYPCPASEVLNITGKFDQYELIDLSGRTVVQDQTSQLQISGLKDGIYLLKITSGQYLHCQKIIIRH